MKITKRVTVVTLLAGVALMQMTAFAGSEGRRNTAAALTGVTLYEAIKGNTKTAVVFGVGSAVAWKQYEIAKDREKRQARSRSAYSGSSYRSGSQVSASSYRGGGYSRYGSSYRRSAAGSGSAVAALKAQNAALKQQMATRQTAMQRKLNELAAQGQVLSRQNSQLTSQLVALRSRVDMAERARNRNYQWALLATILGICTAGGLTYLYFKHPRNMVPRSTVVQATH